MSSLHILSPASCLAQSALPALPPKRFMHALPTPTTLCVDACCRSDPFLAPLRLCQAILQRHSVVPTVPGTRPSSLGSSPKPGPGVRVGAGTEEAQIQPLIQGLALWAPIWIVWLVLKKDTL